MVEDLFHIQIILQQIEELADSAIWAKKGEVSSLKGQILASESTYDFVFDLNVKAFKSGKMFSITLVTWDNVSNFKIFTEYVCAMNQDIRMIP